MIGSMIHIKQMKILPRTYIFQKQSFDQFQVQILSQTIFHNHFLKCEKVGLLQSVILIHLAIHHLSFFWNVFRKRFFEGVTQEKEDEKKKQRKPLMNYMSRTLFIKCLINFYKTRKMSRSSYVEMKICNFVMNICLFLKIKIRNRFLINNYSEYSVCC